MTVPRAMRRWEERGQGDSREETQRGQGPMALGSTVADSPDFWIQGSACLHQSSLLGMALRGLPLEGSGILGCQAYPWAMAQGGDKLPPRTFCCEQ